MRNTMAELMTIASGRAARGPGDELRAAEVMLQRAQDVGDQGGIADANRRLDELFAEARERDAEAKREQSARIRFSSGVRRPLPPPRPSPSAQMNQAILKASGRTR